MAGRNIQPLAEIGKTAAKVHTDLGLVGDEADRETEAFLRFARATKQDAAGAVVAFDDILDSWGLTAKDAQGIMDKLIVSHQRTAARSRPTRRRSPSWRRSCGR
jgi:phage-related minor tail protein